MCFEPSLHMLPVTGVVSSQVARHHRLCFVGELLHLSEHNNIINAVIFSETGVTSHHTSDVMQSSVSVMQNKCGSLKPKCTSKFSNFLCRLLSQPLHTDACSLFAQQVIKKFTYLLKHNCFNDQLFCPVF